MSARRLLKEEAQDILIKRRIEAAHYSTTAAVRLRDPRIRPIPWQLELGELCDQFVNDVLARNNPRLLISAPPRHGKTEYIGRGMPIHAYMKAKEPLSIVYVTSADDRAGEVSAQVQRAMEFLFQYTGDRKYKPSKKWATQEWETCGGLSWKGIGWRKTTGGIGARLLLMDDLIGSAQTYRSTSVREDIKRAIQEDLLSRLMFGGGAAHMETRRGTLDTTQWIQENYSQVWDTHIWRCYDPERGYLWPENYGEEWRKKFPHLTDSSPIWLSLYQQEPVEEGGTLIDPSWLIPTYPETPMVARQLSQRVAIGCDLSNTAKKTSDECAFVVASKRGAYRDILDVVAGHFTFPQQKQIIRDLSAKWNPDKIFVELAAGGDQIEQELKSSIDKIEGIRPVVDKVTRLTPHLDRFASLQVRTPAKIEPWCQQWRQEHQNFTGVEGRPDNRVDATVYALNGCDTASKIDRGAALKALERMR